MSEHEYYKQKQREQANKLAKGGRRFHVYDTPHEIPGFKRSAQLVNAHETRESAVAQRDKLKKISGEKGRFSVKEHQLPHWKND